MQIEHLQPKISQKALITIDDKLLLVLEEKDWELPGGRVDKGELDLETALKRELAEELSITVSITGIFSVYLFTKVTGEVALAIVYSCELMTPVEEIKLQAGEIDGVRFFSKEELKEIPNIFPNSVQAIQKYLS